MADVFIDFGDRRLRGRWLDPADAQGADPYAPTLVFLHEGLGCIELCRPFPAALCAHTGLRGSVYDRTGCGQSSAWPEPPGLRYMEIEADELLPRLLDTVGIQACLLVGHSDGGTSALDFAAVQPPLLRGVVTIGARAVNEPLTISSMQGEHDEYGTDAQLRHIARGVSGRCEARLMPNCGHAPHLQDERTLVEAIARVAATLWRSPSDGRRAAGALLLALAFVLGAAGRVRAQDDACGGPAAVSVLDAASTAMARSDDDDAARGLREASAAALACHEVGLAALAVEGWREARRLALVGGAPDQLSRMRDLLARIDTVRASRPPWSLLAQQAVFADAVLRAAVAAAQDERDEMQVYLAHARATAESLRLGGTDRFWPLPIDLAEGELWLEVDRFAEAQEAFRRAVGSAPSARALAGLGQAAGRRGDAIEACRVLARALDAGLAPAAARRVRDAAARYGCAVE